MDILNSADFRNNLSAILTTVVRKRQPVMVGRFGEPKAVLVDYITYHWQRKVLEFIGRIDKLSSSEIETLNILLDEKTRSSLFTALQQEKEGDVVSFSDFLNS